LKIDSIRRGRSNLFPNLILTIKTYSNSAKTIALLYISVIVTVHTLLQVRLTGNYTCTCYKVATATFSGFCLVRLMCIARGELTFYEIFRTHFHWCKSAPQSFRVHKNVISATPYKTEPEHVVRVCIKYILYTGLEFEGKHVLAE